MLQFKVIGLYEKIKKYLIIKLVSIIQKKKIIRVNVPLKKLDSVQKPFVNIEQSTNSNFRVCTLGLFCLAGSELAQKPPKANLS